MKLRLASLALALVLVSAFAVAPLSLPVTQAQTPPPTQPTNPFTNIPVSGLLGDAGATLTGTLNITRFEAQGRRGRNLVAVGTLSGTIRDASGAVIGTLTNFPVSAPVENISAQQTGPGVCRILHLDLGPINLDLLGLVLTTNRIVIDLTAVQGPGNLLGNLLCTITGLLDRPGNPLARFAPQLADLLNQILAALPRAPVTPPTSQ